MSTVEDIHANASYHAELLTLIAELEYVSSAQSHQAEFVTDLQSRVAQGEKRLQELAEKTKKERKEHESLRDSTARRLAHKLTGRSEKYEAKESKEEREYVDALERELTERESQNALVQMLNEAKHVDADLREKSIRYESFKAELQNLYNRIFEGPSESTPGDDEREYELNAAQRAHEVIQTTLNQETIAAELLTKADQAMAFCQKQMQEALGYSRWDIYSRGGGMSEMMERNALSNAKAYAIQVERLVDQARSACSNVQPVGRVDIAQNSVFSDVFFDNFYSDMAFHNSIKQSATQALLAHNRLRQERDAAVNRANAAGSQLVKEALRLEKCRRDLDSFRRAMFESVAGPIPSGRPPTYSQVASEPPISQIQAPIPEAPSTPIAVSTSGQQGARLHSNTEMRPGSPGVWGSRNPYAAEMAQRTRSMSLELQL